MIRSLYLLVYSFLLVSLLVLLVLFFALFHKDTLPYLAQKYHKELMIEYDKIEGNIFYGVRVEGLVYKDFLQIQELHIEYDLWKLFAPTPRVNAISMQGLVLDLKRSQEYVNAEDQNRDSFALLVESVSMQGTQIVTDDETFVADLNASNILYDNDLTIKNYLLKLDSSYGEFIGKGNLQNKEINADLIYTPSDTIAKEYLADLRLNIPSLQWRLTLNEKRVLLHSFVEELSIKGIEDLLIEDLDLKVNYELQSAALLVDTKSSIKHKDLQGRSFENISMQLYKGARQLDANISYKDFSLQFQTKNYKDFDYQLWSPYLFAQGALIKDTKGFFVKSMIDLNTSLAFLDKLPLDSTQIQKIQLQAQHTKEQTTLHASSALARLDLKYVKKISQVYWLLEINFFIFLIKRSFKHFL